MSHQNPTSSNKRIIWINLLNLSSGQSSATSAHSPQEWV